MNLGEISFKERRCRVERRAGDDRRSASDRRGNWQLRVFIERLREKEWRTQFLQLPPDGQTSLLGRALECPQEQVRALPPGLDAPAEGMRYRNWTMTPLYYDDNWSALLCSVVARERPEMVAHEPGREIVVCVKGFFHVELAENGRRVLHILTEGQLRAFNSSTAHSTSGEPGSIALIMHTPPFDLKTAEGE